MQRQASFTVAGHDLALVESGDERRSLIVEWIDNTQRTLDLLFYDMAEDECGLEIREALCRAAHRGVKVRLIVDGFGLIDLDPDKFFAPLREAGAQAFVFNPRKGRKFLIRNHQKILVADEGRAIIGGANLAADYLRDGEGAWRDLWLRIEGECVGVLVDYFESLHGWMCSKKPKMRDLSDIVARHSNTSGPLQWQFSAPWPRHTPWPAGLIRDLWDAKRVDMVMAYFAPSKAMLRRLARVAREGGEVHLVTPAKSDNNATIAAARHTFGTLLGAGVEIYEYQKTKMHTKLVVVDDKVHIGSSNFDFRSLYLNLEVMLRIEDADAAKVMRDFVTSELADSEAITPELYKQRATLWNRIKWRISHFLVTTMDYTVSRRLNFPLGGDG